MGVATKVMSAGELREAEARTMERVPESALMDKAAVAVASAVRECAPDAQRIVVLAGSGNNGGDALLAGARLAEDGLVVAAVVVGEAAHARGLHELHDRGGISVSTAEQYEMALALVRTADVVIDGIVGLGARPGLRPPADALADAISPIATVVAVDIPSGLEADSPHADARHLRADVTVTFTAPKVCLVQQPAAASAGQVLIADVGVELSPARD